ncbi:hypothetical protein KAW43_00205 [Candidatus Parcubacteria bacterium]|nr:hypothetical protein [Candidatus Parcubacteria bacterium]
MREFKALLLSDEGFKQAEARREDKIPEKFEIDNYDESSDINVIYLTQSLFFPTGKNGWVRIDEDVTKEQLVSLAAKQGYDKYRGIVFVSSSKTDIAGRDAIDINRNIYYYDLYPYLK